MAVSTETLLKLFNAIMGLIRKLMDAGVLEF